MLELLKIALAFIFALGLLVAVHEYGHFWMARYFGIRVLRFSIGFGNPITKWRDAKGTEFWISTIPLGGYVKLLDSREEPVPENLAGEEFSHRPVHQRLAVYFAGPGINLIFAFFLYWLLFVSGVSVLIPKVGDIPAGSAAAEAGFERGYEILAVDGQSTDSWEAVNFALVDRLGDSGKISFKVKVADEGSTLELDVPVNRFLSDAPRDTSPLDAIGLTVFSPRIPPIIGEVVANAPAQRAGMQPGDRVISVDDIVIDDWRHWVSVVRDHPDQSLSVKVLRDNQVVLLSLIPELISDAQGGYGRIGAAAYHGPDTAMTRLIRYNPLAALMEAYHKTFSRIKMTFLTIGKMLVGLVSIENLSGPVTIAKVAGDTVDYGLEQFIGFIAYLSISLGVLNLLPIPVLDGGHILFGVCEWIRGKPLPEMAQRVGLNIGVAILGAFMLVAFYNDVMRLVH